MLTACILVHKAFLQTTLAQYHSTTASLLRAGTRHASKSGAKYTISPLTHMRSSPLSKLINLSTSKCTSPRTCSTSAPSSPALESSTKVFIPSTMSSSSSTAFSKPAWPSCAVLTSPSEQTASADLDDELAVSPSPSTIYSRFPPTCSPASGPDSA